MSRRGARPLAAKKGAENISCNVEEEKKEEKPGFFARLFGSSKSKKEETKQTAAKTRRVRRKSKLAEDDIAVLQEEIKAAEQNVQKLESTPKQLPPPPPPPPPVAKIPPPPPPPPPKVAKEQKISKVVGKTNIPKDEKVVDVHFEMMQAIKNGGRKKLRRTSIRRSIGGTPIKENKKYAPVTDAEVFAASVIIRDSSSDDENQKDNDNEMF